MPSAWRKCWSACKASFGVSPRLFQQVNSLFVTGEDIRAEAGAGSERFRVHVVAVKVLDYENGTVSTAGRNEEATGEIGRYLTSD
jgi:hypothetical protein